MKAVVCKAWGPPESLVIEDRPRGIDDRGVAGRLASKGNTL